jgi:hypothetical protein
MMPTIDPKVAFWFGLAIFVAGAIASGGTSFLSGAIPAAIIPPLVKWCLIISTLGNGVMTYIAGSNMTNAGRIANVQSVPMKEKMDSFANNPEVKTIVTTPALAAATESDKIVAQ